MPPKDPVKPFTAPTPQPQPAPASGAEILKRLADLNAPETPKPAPVAAKPPDPPKPPPPPPPKAKPVVAKYNGLDPALEERLYAAVGKPANDEEFGYPNGAASKVRILRWYPKDIAEQNAIAAAIAAFSGVEGE